ncbi:MAG: hypothetical protein AAB588_06040 [Patescibacteria group bacterium]
MSEGEPQKPFPVENARSSSEYNEMNMHLLNEDSAEICTLDEMMVMVEGEGNNYYLTKSAFETYVKEFGNGDLEKADLALMQKIKKMESQIAALVARSPDPRFKRNFKLSDYGGRGMHTEAYLKEYTDPLYKKTYMRGYTRWTGPNTPDGYMDLASGEVTHVPFTQRTFELHPAYASMRTIGDFLDTPSPEFWNWKRSQALAYYSTLLNQHYLHMERLSAAQQIEGRFPGIYQKIDKMLTRTEEIYRTAESQGKLKKEPREPISDLYDWVAVHQEFKEVAENYTKLFSKDGTVESADREVVELIKKLETPKVVEYMKVLNTEPVKNPYYPDAHKHFTDEQLRAELNELLAPKFKRIPQDAPGDKLREEYIAVIASDAFIPGVEEYAGVRAILEALLKKSSQDLSSETAQMYIPGDPQSRGERLFHLARLVAVAQSVARTDISGFIREFRDKHSEALRVHAQEQLKTRKEIDILKGSVEEN